jgi:excisionase family DNA binding protein
MASDPVKAQENELKALGYGETLKTAEVERVLGCHRQTVLKLVRDGKLSAFKLNTNLRVRRSDLAHFLHVSRTR